MDLHFYFDTAVLGPTYEDGYRHLALSVSAAWAGGKPPEDPRLDDKRFQALLQPWRWRTVGFKLYRGAAGVLALLPDDALEAVIIDDTWLPLQTMVVPDRNRLEALFEKCMKEEKSTNHAFQLRLEQEQSDENPDTANRQCWPDLLAGAGRWPGLLPYRLQLQYMFKVKADEIVPDALYFLVPEEIETYEANGGLRRETVPSWADDGQTPELSVDYRWATLTELSIATARIGGSVAPVLNQAEATGALLDLATLWGRSDAADSWASHDWFAAVPEMVAEACDHPDALFDALTELAISDPQAPEVSTALQTRFEDSGKRDGLIADALAAWMLRYGALSRVGSDGAHPLTSILSGLLKDEYDAHSWRDVLSELGKEKPDGIDKVIDAHNARPEEQSLRILPFDGGTADGLDKRSGLDFVREAARTFAWLTSDAGLFAFYRTPWLAAVDRHALAHPGSTAPQMLRDWLKSEERDGFPLGAMVRGAWCTNGESGDPALRATKPLWAVVDRLHAAPTGDPKGTLTAILSNVDDAPVSPNAPLRDYLVASGIRADATLFEALARVLRTRVEALRRSHLDGSARALPDVPDVYPSAFGDPWPLDRVHDLMFAIDRPGHVDSNDGKFEDLRRQIAGIGLLVRQAGKPWHCLASASILPEGAEASRYAALSGQPSAFAGELRTTMVAYRGEPWFEGNAGEALAIGYDGEAEAGSALTDVRTEAHPDVRFPDLKFGQQYFCKPFIIGPGNALPHELCAGPEGARLHPAYPRDDLFSAGGIDANLLEKGAGPYHYLRRVPVGAPLFEPSSSDTLFSRREDVHPLAHEVLAATTPSEEPLTLLCPSQQWDGKAKQIFRLQPPEVDMMVWLRHWRALIAAKTGGAASAQWPNQLSQALGVWMKQADAIAAQPEGAKSLPKFHDPAHDAYLIEVEQVWPTPDSQSQPKIFRVEGAGASPAAAAAPDGQTRAMTVLIDADGAMDPLPGKPMLPPTIDNRNGEIVVSGFYKGHVYRVSASALVRSARFAAYADADGAETLQSTKVFAPWQIFGASSPVNLENIEYVRFAPRTLLAEIATEKMPQRPTIANAPASVLEEAQASALQKALKPTFDGRTLSVSADFSNVGVEGWQYARTLILERQRWAWGGRHVDRTKVDALVPTGDDRTAFEPNDADGFESWAFHERSPEDHVREFAASAANDPRTVVWREDLQSRRAAEYHRFRLRARSRYAGLMKHQKTESFTETWAPFALKFRPGATALPRPKIAMVLPLTGGYEEVKGSRKLACLVQLDEAAFDEAGLPERIIVEAEMAGPDPILAGKPLTSELKFDCRTHGPIGHSFDPDMPGAKYRRASWVTSFDTPAQDAATGHPWSLVKLRVRREVSRQWVWPLPQGDLASETVSAGWIQLPRPSDQILLHTASADEPKSVAASGLRLRRVEGKSLVTVVRDGTVDAVTLGMEPGFGAMFAVLTYQAIDARGIPGAEQILKTDDAAIGPDGRTTIAAEGLDRAPPGTLRLRLLTAQRNPVGRDNKSWPCESLSDLFARVGETDTSDARFRLMRVSLPIMEG